MHPVVHDSNRITQPIHAIMSQNGESHQSVKRRLSEHGNEGIIRRFSWDDDRFMYADGESSPLREVSGGTVKPRPRLTAEDLCANDWQFEAFE